MVNRVESVQSDLIEPIIPQGSPKYLQLSEKLKNIKVGPDVAWNEFKAALNQVLGDTSRDFSEDILRLVFSMRRDAYFGRITDIKASDDIREAVAALSLETQDKLTRPIVFARDLFARPRAAVRRQMRSR